MKSRTNTSLFFFFAVVMSSLVGSRATAQSFQLDQYRPAELAKDGFVVSRPIDMGHNKWGFQLHVEYANDPLVYEAVVGQASSEARRVVTDQAVAHAVIAYSLWNRVVFFTGVPVNLAMKGEPSMQDPPPDGTSLGDMWLGARVRLLGGPKDIIGVAGQLSVTLPTAKWADSNIHYAGDGTMTAWPEAIVEIRPKGITITANLGSRFRDKSELPAITVSHEFTYGIGAKLPIIEDRFDAHAEIWGSSTWEEFGQRGSSPMQGLIGGKFHSGGGWTLGAAVGAGLTRGYGSPDYRLIGMIGWTQPSDPEVPRNKYEEKDGDRDGDGIPDSLDKCPDDPEDKDGFEDEDGCPDPDNDKDGILDKDDACPNAPGPKENNGCPRLVRLEESQIVILQRIEFEFDSARILPISYPILEEVRAILDVNPQIKKIRIEGHTDYIGTEEYNWALSQRRAESVRQWLVEHGINGGRLDPQGFGESKPLTEDKSDEGRQANRRVEFHIVDPPTGNTGKPLAPKKR